jgi:NTE family protein
MANKKRFSRAHAPYRVGLGLSGGGAKGIAHLGVIKALEEYGLKPEIISGVSAGAIVGALYADGKTPEEICKFFKDSSFFKFVNVIMPRRGFMSSQRFEVMLTNSLKARTFEELSMPLIINATEVIEGKNEYFSTGSLIDKVVASASVPIFLTPKEIEGKMYVDGGIFNNMPCRVIRDKCKLLVGCHVNPIVPEAKLNGVLDIAERVYNLSIQSSTVPEKKACDIVIEPIKARDYGMFEISRTQEIFDAGYEAAIQALQKANLNLDSLSQEFDPEDLEIA